MGGSTCAIAASRGYPDRAARSRLRSQRTPGAREQGSARTGSGPGRAPEEDTVFTGIVEELGEVVGLDADGALARIRIRGPLVAADAARGDSIAM